MQYRQNQTACMNVPHSVLLEARLQVESITTGSLAPEQASASNWKFPWHS